MEAPTLFIFKNETITFTNTHVDKSRTITIIQKDKSSKHPELKQKENDNKISSLDAEPQAPDSVSSLCEEIGELYMVDGTQKRRLECGIAKICLVEIPRMTKFYQASCYDIPLSLDHNV